MAAAVWISIVLVLAGCASSGGGPRRGNSVEAADAAYSDGRFAEAAAIFAQLGARNQQDPRWRLREADARLLAGQPEQAKALLAMLDRTRLDAGQRSLATLLEVLISPEAFSATHVLRELPAGMAVPRSYLADFHRARARAFEELGEPAAAALEYIALDPYLLTPRARQINRERTLSAVQRLSISEARLARRQFDDNEVLRGWLDLVLIMKEAMAAGGDLERAVRAWRTAHPTHPAASDDLAGLPDRFSVDHEAHRQIAVLLPESGPLAAAGAAVRDGIVSAYLNAPARFGEIKFYDTAGNVPGATRALAIALAEGATHLVGPLDKDAAAAVLIETAGRIPVLALNYPDGVPQDLGFQFGLLPENDAEAVALQMIREGRLRVVTMTPASDFGNRVRTAFVNRYTELGGVVFESATYPAAMRDFASLIERITGINEARIRHRTVQSDLNIRLAFEPATRHDIDALFLVARPREGRLIKPQLAFHQAGDIPIYGTSHVYAGSPDSEADQDLNGVGFCDAPWILGERAYDMTPAEAVDHFQAASGASLRLFALGVDAFRMLPYLEWLSQNSSDRFPGLSGSISIDRQRRLRRGLQCARFVNGEPRAVEVETG